MARFAKNAAKFFFSIVEVVDVDGLHVDLNTPISAKPSEKGFDRNDNSIVKTFKPQETSLFFYDTNNTKC